MRTIVPPVHNCKFMLIEADAAWQTIFHVYYFCYQFVSSSIDS